MEQIINKVQELSKQIEDAERKKSRVEGRLEEQQRQLKELTGTDDIEEAEKVLNDMIADLDKTEVKIRKKFEELEKEYEF